MPKRDASVVAIGNSGRDHPQMTQRAEARPLLEMLGAESRSRYSHIEKTMQEDGVVPWMVVGGKPVSWARYFQSNTRNQRRLLEGPSEFFDLKNGTDTALLIKSVMQEAERNITDLKFRQKIQENSLKLAVKGWEVLVAGFSPFQSDDSLSNDSSLRGLIYKDHP